MDYSAKCIYSTRLIDKLEELDETKQLDFNLINQAIYWAKKYHDGQFRKSGEPFYSHPLEVAYMVSDYKLKTDVIVTSILHDIIEDTIVTAGMIVDAFGWRIATMVDMLTRDRPDGTKLTVEQILNNAYEKGEKEVLLIKCVDRLHNMQTVGVQSPEKVQKILLQTIQRFVSLSIYLADDVSEALVLERIITRLCTQTIEAQKMLADLNDNATSSDNFQLPSLTLRSIISRIHNQ